MPEEREFTYENYVDVFNQTAMYPGVGTSNWEELSYLTLGLIGEMAEHQDNPGLGELGDMLWYLCGLDMLLDRRFDVRMISTSSNFVSPVGNLANIVKKVLRDGDSEDRYRKIEAVYNDLLFAAEEVCNDWEVDINEVRRRNAEKLLSRKERGVIQGDGDNR